MSNFEAIAVPVYTVIALALVSVIIMTVNLIVQIYTKRRRFAAFGVKDAFSIVMFLLLVAGLGYVWADVPQLWSGLTVVWDGAEVLVFVLVVSWMLYFFVAGYFPKPNEKSYFVLAILSIVGGLASSMVVFLLNRAVDSLTMNGTDSLVPLIPVFVVVTFLFVYSQKSVRFRLISLANQLVYEKRMGIVRKLLDATYQQLEKVEKEKIYSALNNDTERVSGVVNAAVQGTVSLVTVLVLFIYLAFIHLYAFLFFFCTLLVVITVFLIYSRMANRFYEQVRDLQNAFFKKIDQLVKGLKELFLHRGKIQAFQQEMDEVCTTYREKRSTADRIITGLVLISETAVFVIIGVLIFVLPLVFASFDGSLLRGFVFVFLFIISHITTLLNLAPQLIQMRVSWNRINALEAEVQRLGAERVVHSKNMQQAVHELQLVDVTYVHRNHEQMSVFQIGPVNLTLRSGQITYITGGNGSGKTTLAKVLTGLYAPTSGKVLLNGTEITMETLSQQFSTVFSDFHLFDKLYGVDFKAKEQEIQDNLKILKLDDKVSVHNGQFSTTQLSTGQRKRLALLVSYLDDRPIVLLDEWAADQDPEYRAYYYERILPDLRERGKCVVIITHDDRYFKLADQLVKMEMGRMEIQA